MQIKKVGGDLLIVNDNFHQTVSVTREFSLNFVDDVTLPGVIDDIIAKLPGRMQNQKG